MTLLALLVGCADPPPQAPQELDELVGYMFAHTPDEDPAALEVGAVNMDEWLVDGIDLTAAGYEVNNLTEDTVDALGEGDRDLEGLVGASVGHISPYPPEELVAAALGDDPVEIFAGSYVSYERDILEGDLDAFIAGDDDWLYGEAWTFQDWTLVTIDSYTRVQYRWIDTPDGRALIQRNWLREPATINVDFLQVTQQYYQYIVLPEAGGSRTLQTTWVIASLSDSSVNEDTALGLVITSMQGMAEDLDAWVEEKQSGR